MIRRGDGGAQPRHTAANYKDIGKLLRQTADLERQKVASLGEKLIHRIERCRTIEGGRQAEPSSRIKIVRILNCGIIARVACAGVRSPLLY